MTVRWRFDDPTDSSFATFEINPDAGGTPARSITLTTQNTLAPGGKNIVFEGAEDPLNINFSGTILTQTMLALLNTWFSKKHQVQLTDDLGRVYMVMITKFTPKRVRSSNFWKHTYDCTAIVVNYP